MIKLRAVGMLLALTAFPSYGQSPVIQSNVGIFRDGFAWLLDSMVIGNSTIRQTLLRIRRDRRRRSDHRGLDWKRLHPNWNLSSGHSGQWLGCHIHP
jgi:hypothetical protein